MISSTIGFGEVVLPKRPGYPQMDFSKIAPYLSDPLVLTGFALFVFFGFARAILSSGIVPTLTQNSGFRLMSRLLLYGFVLAIAVIVVGFIIKYREMSHRDQASAVNLIVTELKGNKLNTAELAANTATILEDTLVITKVIRDNRFPIPVALFPWKNIQPTEDSPSPSEMARLGLEKVAKQKLDKDKIATGKFQLLRRAIFQTLDQTRSTIVSLSDARHSRYTISRASWNAQLPILRRVHDVDVSQLGSTYSELDLARSEYDIVVARALEYLDAVRDFVDPSRGIDEGRLARVLASERLFYAIARKYASVMSTRLADVDRAVDALSQASSQ